MATAKSTVSGSAEDLRVPAHFPTATHQSITGFLFTEISVYLKAREPQCRVMSAPFAVFFKNMGGTCVQPDIVVVQDEGKLDEDGCHGAPDWVIEVVSASSRESDYGKKLGIYINAGVREYWIVDSEKKLIVTYCLEHPDVPAIYHFGDIIKSDIHPDLIIDSSPLNLIQYKKSAYVKDSGDADMVSSLVSAVKKALADTDSRDPIPAGLLEDIVAKELQMAGLQSESCQPAHPESPDAAGGNIPDAGADLAEVKAFIQEHFGSLAAAKNKGQLMKAAMSALKGRAESRIINDAVVELCR